MTEQPRPTDVQLYTAAEVAEILHVSERQVRRQIKSGELPHYKIGTAIRVSRADLEAFLAQRRHKQEKPRKTNQIDHDLSGL